MGGLPVVYLEQLNLIGALRRRLRDFHLCISISQDSLSRSSVLTAKEYVLFTELACKLGCFIRRQFDLEIAYILNSK